jgi:hypothetical protein
MTTGPVVSDLINQHSGQFAVITYHYADAFNVPWGDERLDTFYSLGGATPTMMFDGWLNCPSRNLSDCLNQQLAVAADTTIEPAASQVSGPTWDVTAEICVDSGAPSRTMRIYTAPALNDHPNPPDYSRNLLMQAPGVEDVTLAGGNCQTVTTRITFDSESWSNQNNIVVVIWAQEPNSSGPATAFQAATMPWPFPQATELTSIVISPQTAEISVGESQGFTAVGKDQFGADFPLSNPEWSMTGDGEGTLDPTSGSTTTEFSATQPGTVQITCSEGSVSGTATLVIAGDPPALSEIVVAPATAEMVVGQHKIFVATGHDQYGNDIGFEDPQWQAQGDGSGSFDPPSGSSTPQFIAETPGDVQIICSVGDISGHASVVITGDPPQLTEMTVNPDSATVPLGSDVIFTATGIDQYGDPYTPDNAQWSVSGDGFGTFDPSTGSATVTFTATTAGECTVTAQQDGLSASATVDITEVSGLPKPRRVKARHTP